MFSLKSPVNTFVSTVKGVLLSPVKFFQTVSWEKVPVADSLVFALICYAFAQIMGFLLSSLSIFSFLPQAMRNMATSSFGLTYFIVAFVIAIVLFFVNAFVIYAVVKYVFKSKSSFNAVLAVLSSLASVSLLGWIPIIGLIIVLYGLVLTVIAVREMAKLSTVQAIISLIISFLINMVLTGVLFAKILASFYSNLIPNQNGTNLHNQIPNYHHYQNHFKST